jgi:hypothetical protein
VPEYEINYANCARLAMKSRSIFMLGGPMLGMRTAIGDWIGANEAFAGRSLTDRRHCLRDDS